MPQLFYLWNVFICKMDTIIVSTLVAQLLRNPPTMQETPVRFLGWVDAREKGKATHFSILAWRIDSTVHGVTTSQTKLSNFHFTFITLWWGLNYLKFRIVSAYSKYWIQIITSINFIIIIVCKKCEDSMHVTIVWEILVSIATTSL